MGKTDFELDLIGWRLDQRPVPILYVGPTKQFVVEQFEPRVMALLDEAKGLAAKVLRGKRMTKTRKTIAGVPLRLAHGGSSSALKSDPAAFAIVDELDELLSNVKKQGDPLALVEARGDTYADFVCVVSSTPSVGAVDIERDATSGLDLWKPAEKKEDVESPIWRLWQAGTRHHFTWPCPHCGGWFVPRFSLLRWKDKATPAEARADAWIDCQHCGAEIREEHKAAMNAAGVFVAPGQAVDAEGNVTGDPPASSTLSFWTSGLCSPFVTFGERAGAYLEAEKLGDEKVQTVINAGFGELWSEMMAGGEQPEALELNKLKRPYKLAVVDNGVVKPDAAVPDEAIVITGAIDVQKDYLRYVIRGWGGKATSWLIGRGNLLGATGEPEVWEAADALVAETIAGLPVQLWLVDSGFRPNKTDAGDVHTVYEFCRRHPNCRPIKGQSTMKTPVRSSRIEVTPKGRAAKYGLELVHINTDWAKSWVHGRIRWPVEQPGAWHLAEDAPDEYLAGILSEVRIVKPSGKAEWIRRSRNNHDLDCEAMNYAAGYILNVQRLAVGATRSGDAAEPSLSDLSARLNRR